MARPILHVVTAIVMMAETGDITINNRFIEQSMKVNVIVTACQRRNMRHIASIPGSITILVLLLSSRVLAANSNIEGHVKDASTGGPLVHANIVLVGTSRGAATDMDGKYVLLNVLPGSYTVRASYIGYKSQQMEFSVKEGLTTQQDFVLTPVAIEGETIVVTGQAKGQVDAINKQLAADQIINVVSAAKIQELPDANAAESVGRLPGVTVLRTGGEGDAVVIRGLEPKFNKILIDGVQMSSSDPNDRSTDLSTISSSMLDGIEVSKTVTADMDADVLGGTVNFTLREAKASGSDIPLIDALVQGGYNNLPDATNKYNNYKFVLSGENRYLDNRFGVFAQLDMERKNLSSNELGAAYTHADISTTDYYTTGLGLSDIQRDRQRFNGALVLDYKLDEGSIKLSNFGSSGNTNIVSRYENLDITNNNHLFQLSHSAPELNILTNALELQQQLPIFQMDLKLSHTYSEVKDRDNWSMNFLETGAGLGGFNLVRDTNPEDIPKAATNDFTQAITNGISTSDSFSKERALNASLDLKTNVNISDFLNADIKVGGKYRYQTRSYAYDLYNGGGMQFGDALYVNQLIISHFQLPVPLYKISLPYFRDPNFSYGKFLDGKYSMVEPMSYGKIAELVNLIKSHTADIAAYPGGAQVYGLNNFSSNSSNYSGNEKQSAFYAMSTMHIGEDITLIPGVRYQNLQTTYTGVRGTQNKLSYLNYLHYDTTVTKSHGYWLPDVSLRYKPTSWCDIRLSYTKTLAYPDFNAIIPRIDVDNNFGIISYNNYNLSPQRSTNYDAYLSFYDNSIGLFTIGAFTKQIDDLIYGWTFYASGANLAQYYPPQQTPTKLPANAYQVNTFVNNSHRANDYGYELDWQTHFWYLPSPFSGLVFSVNYTHIFSKAVYPYTTLGKVGRTSVYIDTTFTDRLLDQPDDIANFSLGYDYGGFSIRVSMLYQSDIFTGVNFWPQLRSHTSAYKRWDLAVKQDLPWYGLQVFCNLNNINGANDVSVIQGGGVPLAEQEYGLTGEVGLRCRF
jgi:TonB-dependent receptor